MGLEVVAEPLILAERTATPEIVSMVARFQVVILAVEESQETQMLELVQGQTV